MLVIGYHASHEQFSPSELLRYVRDAEAAGFDAIMTSDHITPWSERQRNSGNNWAWLGAAMSNTSLPFGSLAIPGGWRYHPVVLAHMIATVSEMTVRKPSEELTKMIDRFRAGGGDGKPVAVQLQLSWGQSNEEARKAAWDQWRVAAVSPDHLANLETAHEFDLETEAVSPEEMDDVIPLVTTAREVLDLIEDMKSCRVDEIYIHNVSRDQSAFLKFMASEVMPAIDRT